MKTLFDIILTVLVGSAAVYILACLLTSKYQENDEQD